MSASATAVDVEAGAGGPLRADRAGNFCRAAIRRNKKTIVGGRYRNRNAGTARPCFYQAGFPAADSIFHRTWENFSGRLTFKAGESGTA